MPVDIETEVVQLWAASRVVADTMKSKLPRQPDGLTIPQSGIAFRSRSAARRLVTKY